MEITIPNSLLFNKVVLKSQKRICSLRKVSNLEVDFKNISLLKNHVSEQGRIISSKFSLASFRKQKMISRAIKIARHISLLPYIKLK